MTRDCDKLGEFDLTGIPPMPRGVPQIEITYDLDANGILNVSALEKSTSKSNKITIKNDRQRTKEDIDRMVAEAAQYEAEDKAVVARVEARNKAEAYLYQAKAAVQEEQMKSALGAEAVEKVTTLATEGLQWLEDNRDADVDALEAKQTEWSAVITPLMSAAAGGPQKGGPEPDEPVHQPVVEEVD
jgi:L1 cell adhesion molecule like protein